MGGSDAVERFHRLDDVFVKPDAAVDATGHDRFEPDSGQIPFGLYVPGLFQLKEAIANCFGIIGHPLEAAFVQKALVAVREIEQPPLQGSRAEIGDEDFHQAIAAICPDRAGRRAGGG